MANYIEKCGVRFCNNNWLNNASVNVSAETDYNTSTIESVFNTRDFGIYRLTKDPTSDHFIIDIELPNSLEPTTFALIPVDVNKFYLTDETTVKIEASNFGFSNVQKTFTGIHSRFGVFCNFTELDTQNNYKYWRVKISTGNRSNFDETLDIKYAYFGDHVGLTTRNITKGFGVDLVDLSEVFTSEAGRNYWNKKEKRLELSGLRFQYMNKQDRVNFQQFFYCVSNTENFLTVIDPEGKTSGELLELIRVMHFKNIPNQRHEIRDMFDISYTLTEAL